MDVIGYIYSEQNSFDIPIIFPFIQQYLVAEAYEYSTWGIYQHTENIVLQKV